MKDHAPSHPPSRKLGPAGRFDGSSDARGFPPRGRSRTILRSPAERTARRFSLLVLFVVLSGWLSADEPVTMPLWPGDPPNFLADAPSESVAPSGAIRGVARAAVTDFPVSAENRSGRALILCAGGGFGALDWKTHVVYAADVLNRLGVTVIGLKYRLRPPHQLDNAGIQALALLDAKRAIRLARFHALDWGIDPNQVGIGGYSAGANVAMNLAANFDQGDPAAADPVERFGCRPDFAVGMATWHWRQKTSPFRFPADAPPVFLLHATNDGLPNEQGQIGGAPIELPRAIARDLDALGVPVKLLEFDEGAHGVGNLIPQRVARGFPPSRWPWLLLEWLDSLPGP